MKRLPLPRRNSSTVTIGIVLVILFVLFLIVFWTTSSSSSSSNDLYSSQKDKQDKKKKFYASTIQKLVEQQAAQRRILKHALGSSMRKSNKHSREHRPELAKEIYFVGDSHALRMFRFASLFLFYGQHLKADSADWVSDHVLENLESGIHKEKERIELELAPNSARLERVLFIRAPYLEEASKVIEKLTAHHSSSSSSSSASSSKKKFVRRKSFRNNVEKEELGHGHEKISRFFLLSLGNWNLLRPSMETTGFTFDSLLLSQTSTASSPNYVGGVPSTTSSSFSSFGGVDEENHHDDGQQQGVAAAMLLEKTVDRWRESCEILTKALEAAAAASSTSSLSSSASSTTSVGKIQNHFLWRWSANPNCSASRFQKPRATKSLFALCPMISKVFWKKYQLVVESTVGDHEHHHQQKRLRSRDSQALTPYSFTFMPERSASECAVKVDGVHPSLNCVAKEAIAVLLRAVS